MSLTLSITFLNFLVFKHAECLLKRFKRPAAVIKTDYNLSGFIKMRNIFRNRIWRFYHQQVGHTYLIMGINQQ